MSENIIQELNAKFNDMELKSKNKSENMVVWQEDSNVNRKSNNYHTEDHVLMDRKCEQPSTAVMDNFYDELHNKPMRAEDNTNYQQRQLPHSNGVFMRSYNSLQPQDMAAMQNHDVRFNLTTELMAVQTAHLMQLLDTIDCDNCHSKNQKEKPSPFKAIKQRNVRRTEYQLSGRKTYRSNVPNSAPDFSADLSSMPTGMYDRSEYLRRFYEQLEYDQGCKNCGDI